MATQPITQQPRLSKNKVHEAGGGQHTPTGTTGEEELEDDWVIPRTDTSSKGQRSDDDTTPENRAGSQFFANQSTDFSEVEMLLKQVEDLQAAQKKMLHEQVKLKQQLKQRNEEIARLCEQRGAEGVLQSGEYHSARSTPHTSLEPERDASSRPSTGPHSKEGGRLLQELDDYKSQIGRFKKENAELLQSVDTKHKRIVDLERRLDIATQLQPQVERLTMELSKYQQGGGDSRTEKSDSAKKPSQRSPQEESYQEKLRREIDALRPYKTRAEEAENKLKACEKEYHFERKTSAKLQNQIDALKLEIAELKSGTGPITNIDEYEVLDVTSESTEHKASLEREGEEGSGREIAKERDSKKERERRQEAMVREQNKEWKRSLSENDQEMEKKMSERDREWEQRLEEKQREWEERIQRLQKEREVELQEKRKEIQRLKNKVKELEKAAALLGKVQQHSKGQSHQLMQLQDEVKAKDEETDDIRKSMESMENRLDELETQNQELAKERGQLKEENRRLQKLATPKELAKERGQLKEARARLEGQVAQLEADIAIRTQDKERVQNQLRSITDQCNALKRDIQALKKERDELKETLQTTEAQGDFDAERSDRERAHAQRNEEGERYKEEISRLQSELEHTRQQLKSHKGNLSGLEDVHQRRQKELMAALDQLKAAQEEVQAKTSQVKQYKKQHDQATAEMATLKADNKELMTQFEMVRKKLEDMTKAGKGTSKTEPKADKASGTQITALQQENSGLKQEMIRVRKELEKSMEKLSRKKKKKTPSTSDISITSPVSDLDMSVQMELAELREEYRKLQEENDDLKNKVRALKDSKEALTKHYSESTRGAGSSQRNTQKGHKVNSTLSNAASPVRSFEESQGTAGKGNFRHTVPHGVPQGQSTPAYLHHESVRSQVPVSEQTPGQPYSQPNEHGHLQQREQKGSPRADEQHADYVNQSRVQAMVMESKKRKHRHHVSPEPSYSAPMPGEPQFDLPPPMIPYSEEVTQKPSDSAAAMNRRGPLHVQGNLQQGGSVQGRAVDRYGEGRHGGNWDGGRRVGYAGSRDGYVDGRGGYGEGEYSGGAQLGGEQWREMEKHHLGDRLGVLEDQCGPTSLPSISHTKLAAYKHQQFAESPGRLRSGSNPERHAHLRKKQSPVHVPEDPLTTSIDADMHDVVEYFMDEEGREHPVTGLQAPVDPNLTCPACGRVFRVGEIQMYRRHVDSCGGSEV